MAGRRLVGAIVAVVAIVAGACGGRPGPALKSSRSSSSQIPARISSQIVVDGAATPARWVPVDYGDAQLSVPADWYVTLDGCEAPNAPGTMMLQRPSSAATTPGQGSPCPIDTAPGAGSSGVKVGPIEMSGRFTNPPPVVINGIVVDIAGETACAASGPCPTWYVVPSLGVEIVDDENLGDRTPVIDTLTHSPRAVALASGSVPPVRAGWHLVSFGGISVRVPAQWSVQELSNWTTGCGFEFVMNESGVTFDRGSTSILPSCPSQSLGGQPTQVPKDGLLIDPGMYGPVLPDTAFGTCLNIHELSVCPSVSDPYGILVAAVHLPGRAQPVAVEIGLAGTGVTARGMLYSLRAASRTGPSLWRRVHAQ
jgi:hypothetical protein